MMIWDFLTSYASLGGGQLHMLKEHKEAGGNTASVPTTFAFRMPTGIAIPLTEQIRAQYRDRVESRQRHVSVQRRRRLIQHVHVQRSRRNSATLLAPAPKSECRHRSMFSGQARLFRLGRKRDKQFIILG
jgi:hypothetical protein